MCVEISTRFLITLDISTRFCYNNHIINQQSRLDMEYDYEFMWDYEISVHDDLDENVYTQYAELDENYARRESTDFQTLAYMHYAC